MIQFGTGGNPAGFYENGFQKSEQMPKYLAKLGLNAYEYECTHGIRMGDEKATILKKEAIQYDIALSVHSPYYISLSTQDKEKQRKSMNYLLETMQFAKKIGAKKVVVHAGSTLKMERKFAVEAACKMLKETYKMADEKGLDDIIICPETMGKTNQLGDSKEIIQMCQVDARMIPTIDFGHLYCRTFGALNSMKNWKAELSYYIEELGYERMKHFHGHFSKMIYSPSGGEKKHVTFKEEAGPDFKEVAMILKELKLEPTIICESAGTQEKDAVIMKQIYEEINKDEV